MGNQKVYCPKCRSNDTHNLGVTKDAFRGYRRMMFKYKCNKCGYEFWK